MSIAEYLCGIGSAFRLFNGGWALREDANEAYLHVAGVSAFPLRELPHAYSKSAVECAHAAHLPYATRGFA